MHTRQLSLLLMTLALCLCSAVSGQAKRAGRATLCGYVSDASSQETLIGAAVFSAEHHVGTVTDGFGFFSLTLPDGPTTITIQYIGYEHRTTSITLHGDTIINIFLRSNNALPEVTVASVKREVGIQSTNMGSHNVSAAMLQKMPASLGETDVIKTLQLLPGVQSGTEGFSGMFVRGGGVDQNLIMLDGIPLYNAEHMLGIFSVFTAEAVKSTTLYKSSFPARYGGRLSSIVDVRTNDGDLSQIHGSLTLSPVALTEKISLQGPLWRDHTSFSVSARVVPTIFLGDGFPSTSTSTFGSVTENEKAKYNYYFYDFNAKLTHRFSDYDRIFLCYYAGRDHYVYKSDLERESKGGYGESFVPHENYDSDIEWGNTVAYLRWNHTFSPRLVGNTTVAYNQYALDVDQDFAFDEEIKGYPAVSTTNSSRYSSGIVDYSLRSEYKYQPSQIHNVRFGLEYLHHKFKPETSSVRLKSDVDNLLSRPGSAADDEGLQPVDTIVGLSASPTQKADEVSVFAEDDYDALPWLRLNAGLRMSAFHTDNTTFYSPQPRLSARIAMGADYALKAGYSRMVQYVHLLNATPFSMPTDLWVPVTKRVRPMTADQYSVGFYYDAMRGWELSAETYYKDMRNVIEYVDGTQFFGSSTNWEDKVDMGRGRAYGLELMLERTKGWTTGWVNYTLAKSELRFDNGSISGGRWYPHRYDRRHTINMCVNHRLTSRIDFGASWVYYSGGCITVPERRTLAVGPTGDMTIVSYISGRNNYRLPASHRLNIGFNFTKHSRRGSHVWNLSVYNVYCAKNPSFVYTSYAENYGTRVRKVTLLPILPSLTYTFKF